MGPHFPYLDPPLNFPPIQLRLTFTTPRLRVSYTPLDLVLATASGDPAQFLDLLHFLHAHGVALPGLTGSGK